MWSRCCVPNLSRGQGNAHGELKALDYLLLLKAPLETRGKWIFVNGWFLLVCTDKIPEAEGYVDQKAVEGGKNGTMKSEEPEKSEEKRDNQGEKDGKNKQCKHKREKEPGEQGKPKTDAQDKDEISKERKQPE